MRILSLFFVVSFLSVSVIMADDNPDCSNIAQQYQQAKEFWDSEVRYNHQKAAVDILNPIYEKCKNHSPDRVTLAHVTYILGQASWSGKGTDRDYCKACDYFKEILEHYKDVDPNGIGLWAQHFVGDCARNAKVFGYGENDWTKAVSHYQKVLDNPSVKLDSKLRAWTLARMADAYHEGDGLPQSDAQCVKLFTKVLEDEANITDKTVVAWANFWIADAYEYGKSVEKDEQKARAMFTDIVNKHHCPYAVKDARIRLAKLNASDDKQENDSTEQ